jgi:hypothetical protein
MNAHEPPDPVLRGLADLRPMSPSVARDRRVLSRCHAVLAERSRMRGADAHPLRGRAVDVALAVAIGMYGAIAALESVRMALER